MCAEVRPGLNGMASCGSEDIPVRADEAISGFAGGWSGKSADTVDFWS